MWLHFFQSDFLTQIILFHMNMYCSHDVPCIYSSSCKLNFAVLIRFSWSEMHKGFPLRLSPQWQALFFKRSDNAKHNTNFQTTEKSFYFWICTKMNSFTVLLYTNAEATHDTLRKVYYPLQPNLCCIIFTLIIIKVVENVTERRTSYLLLFYFKEESN